ncbi:MAG: hypothetical protein HQL34_05785 [Alphaproteobacteria bacterium]|nr:hypothetical protein [Alphaproteobacteria bacterium]
MSENSLWDASVIAILAIACAVYIGRRALRLFGKGGGACGSSCCSGGSGCDAGPVAEKGKGTSDRA